MSDHEPLLAVEELRTWLTTDRGEARAVDGVSFTVEARQTVGLVGESGCGKSMTALSILGLIPDPPGRIVTGSSVRFRGEELTCASRQRLRQVRGAEIAMIFQEPMTSLNPVLTVGDQIAEAIRAHHGGSRTKVRRRVVNLLDRVGIVDPRGSYSAYPHQLSGGMRQRAMIAMALSCDPSLLIADEPTTALDVTIQAQILDLLRSLRDELGMAVLLISHDLAVVAELADTVAVMYAGQIVEQGRAAEVFTAPQHPYTQGLLRSIPDPDRSGRRLESIPGSVPRAFRWPQGCRFHPRCPHAWNRCREANPRPMAVPGGVVRCWLAEERAGKPEAGR